jgi:hypothetical protein
MAANPYEPPAADEPSPHACRSRSLCVVGLFTAIACFAGAISVSAVWRFGEEGPISSARRVAAGVVLLLNIGMYAGLIVAVVSGVMWMVRRR